jgi:hypothetical protein
MLVVIAVQFVLHERVPAVAGRLMIDTTVSAVHERMPTVAGRLGKHMMHDKQTTKQ